MHEITLLTSLTQLLSHYLLSEKLEKYCEAEEPPLPAGQLWLLMNLYVEWTSNSGQKSFSVFVLLVWCSFFLVGICLKLLCTFLPDISRFRPISAQPWKHFRFVPSEDERFPQLQLPGAPHSDSFVSHYRFSRLLMALRCPSWAGTVWHSTSTVSCFPWHSPASLFSTVSMANFNSPHSFPCWK